ncbi:MAG: hypothetical protein VX527_12035 [Planctomycetota bacterium]|nr:hypothetical protein [Planctomycetota bacterium]
MTRIQTCLLALSLGFFSQAVAEEPAQFLAVLSGQPPRVVELGTIEATGSDLLDAQEGWFKVESGDCLAVIRRGNWTPRPSRTRVILQDGQVLPGVLLSGDEESIRMDHLWMRELDIPLERINRIEFRSNVVVPPGELDRVVLVNGDTLEGFVNTVNDPITIEVQREDVEKIQIPLDRAAAISFGGPPKSASWPQVWTLDGVRISVPRVEVDASGRLNMAPHEFMVGEYERLPRINEIVALVLDGSRFTPLAKLPVRTINTSIARRTAPPPRREDPLGVIGLSSLLLGGPARYEFTVPPGSDRFRTTLQRPRSSRRWPSPKILITMGDRELWSGVFEDDVELNLPLDTGVGSGDSTLVIDVSCGSQGPVHCGVLLIDPIVLNESQGSS